MHLQALGDPVGGLPPTEAIACDRGKAEDKKDDKRGDIREMKQRYYVFVLICPTMHPQVPLSLAKTYHVYKMRTSTGHCGTSNSHTQKFGVATLPDLPL